MATILPKKANFEQPMALDDDHYDMLASDPTIQQFPQGSKFGGSTVYGASPMGGFGSSGSFSSPGFNQAHHGSMGMSPF